MIQAFTSRQKAVPSGASLTARILFAIASMFIAASPAFGDVQSIANSNETTLVVESSPDMEIISFSKKVIIKKEAKGVLVFGNDVEIEGRVDGDVATIGGSVIQKEGSYIGGDVIVFGGKYSPESSKPLRGEGRQTIIYAAYEEEFRSFARDPFALFSPTFTVGFVALRILLLLFWFLLSLGFTTIAPGAVTRAVARIRLSSVKIVAIGFFAFLGANVLLFGAITALPNYVNAVLVGMGLLTLALAYVFGRVTMHVVFGKLIQKYLLSERNRSESLAVLLGVTAWTILLSLPFVWIFALLAVISTGIGLAVTARHTTVWKAG